MVNKDYKRLTVYNEELQRPCMTADFNEEIPDIITRHAQRLYELENAIEKGTLVFLPCKAGDMVWFVNKYRTTKQIEPYIVDRIILTSSKTILDTHQAEPPQSPGLIYSDSFGRNVFFAKEAAEKALGEE